MLTLHNLPRARGQDRDLDYLLQLASKHNLTPAILRSAMTTARQRGKARCGKFRIQLRMRGDQSSTYMFSLSDIPFAQAEIANESIEKLRKFTEESLEFGAGRQLRSGRNQTQNTLTRKSEHELIRAPLKPPIAVISR
jgi:hypothetical protein